MRAAMKLATGVVPVALGVAMTLMSGVAKAEEKATQPLTGAVSAQTTLPSVGHRPKTITNVSLSVSGSEILNKYYVDHSAFGNVGILFMPGHRVSVESFAPKLHDEDNLFGGDDEPLLTCDVYRIDTVGNETLLNSEIPCRYDNLYTFKLSDVGYKFRFQLYTEASKYKQRNYVPNPNKSLPGYSRYITTQVVKPYVIGDFTSSISSNTIMADGSDSINYSVTLTDKDGLPIKKMEESIKILLGRGGTNLYFSPVREISDGVYSVTIKTTTNVKKGDLYIVQFQLNGHTVFEERITVT